MDDEAALIARHVAMAAAAWFNAPRDVDAYRRLSEAVDDWNAYIAPRILDLPDELLDDLGADSPPVLLGESMPGLEATLREAARRHV